MQGLLLYSKYRASITTSLNHEFPDDGAEVISTAMSSSKQDAVFHACKDSSLKRGDKQFYTSILLQLAPGQEELLPKTTALAADLTPAHQEGPSQFQCLHL